MDSLQENDFDANKQVPILIDVESEEESLTHPKAIEDESEIDVIFASQDRINLTQTPTCYDLEMLALIEEKQISNSLYSEIIDVEDEDIDILNISTSSIELPIIISQSNSDKKILLEDKFRNIVDKKCYEQLFAYKAQVRLDNTIVSDYFKMKMSNSSASYNISTFKTRNQIELKNRYTVVPTGNPKPDFADLIECYCKDCDQTYRKASVGKDQNCPSCQMPLVYQCVKCKRKWSKWLSSIHQHIITICQQQYSYHCNDCDYVAKSEWSITNHIYKRHSNIEEKNSIKCPTCGSNFKINLDRNNYKQTCDNLNKDLSNLKVFKISNANHKSEIYQCKFCAVKTKHLIYLAEHMTKVHNHNINQNEEDLKKQFIDVHEKTDCPKMVKSSSSKRRQHKSFEYFKESPKRKFKLEYKSHFNTRRNFAPKKKRILLYKCSECGKRFGSLHFLKYHWEHCLNLELKCDLCDYTNKYKSNLINHVKQDHANILL